MVDSATPALRVGFLIDRFDIGGTELNAIKVAELLTRRAVSPTVFHLQPDGPLRARYEAIGCELLHVPLRGLLSASAVSAAATIRRSALARGLDVLHSHCVYTNVLGAGIRRWPGTRARVIASRRWTGSLPRRGLSVLNRVAQSAADAVLVNSPSLVDLVRRESPFSNPVYVPNVLPDSAFARRTVEARRIARAELGVRDDGPVVGCVARLTAVKNHAMLLRAWVQVIAGAPDATLLIIGDGPLRESLEMFAQELGIRASVVFAGALSPESLPHGLLDVNVLPSSDEGFPNSIVEAMAQGVPTVATRVGGIPDLVRDGDNGVLVPSDDARALATAIRRLLDGANDVSAMVASGGATASGHRADVMLDLLLDLYHGVARGV